MTWRRRVYVCDKAGCQRVVHARTDEYYTWLVSGPPVTKNGSLVVRCPQHITKWSLAQSGYGVSRDMIEWARKVKAEDEPPEVPVAEPYVLADAMDLMRKEEP